MKKIGAAVLFGVPLLVAAPPFVMGRWMYGLFWIVCAALWAGTMLLSLRWRTRMGMVIFVVLTVVALSLPLWVTEHGWLSRYSMITTVTWDVIAAIFAAVMFAGLHLWRTNPTKVVREAGQ